ncbi:hypothetical protein ACROYT_G013833 [Oculina patagonica]
MAPNANDPRFTARIEARTDLLRQRRKLRQSILARKDDETVERLLRQLADHWGTFEDKHYEYTTHLTDEEFDLLENGKEKHAALPDGMEYEKVGNIHLGNIKSLHDQKQCEKEDSKNTKEYSQEIPKYDNAREVTEDVIATERNKQEMALISMENEKDKILPKNTLVETDKQPKEKIKEILPLPHEKDDIKYNNIMKGCAQEDSFKKNHELPLPVYIDLNIHRLTRSKRITQHLHHARVTLTCDFSPPAAKK